MRHLVARQLNIDYSFLPHLQSDEFLIPSFAAYTVVFRAAIKPAAWASVASHTIPRSGPHDISEAITSGDYRNFVEVPAGMYNRTPDLGFVLPN